MKTIAQLLDELIGREGGYVNDPRDSGGETNFGITANTARGYGYTGPMRTMPVSTARAIYAQLYWTKPGFDRVAGIYPEVAAELFDTGVNMGPKVATTFLQRSLNALNRNGADYLDLVPDGRMGDQTYSALARFADKRGVDGERVLLAALNALQGERYISLAETHPKNEAFLYGWLANRVAA